MTGRQLGAPAAAPSDRRSSLDGARVCRCPWRKDQTGVSSTMSPSGRLGIRSGEERYHVTRSRIKSNVICIISLEHPYRTSDIEEHMQHSSLTMRDWSVHCFHSPSLSIGAPYAQASSLRYAIYLSSALRCSFPPAIPPNQGHPSKAEDGSLRVVPGRTICGSSGSARSTHPSRLLSPP